MPDDNGHHHDGHHDHDGHGHGHGHHNDQGLKAVIRYLRHAPDMWRSEINVAVLHEIDPQPGERVLDIGAGMGPAMAAATKAGATVVAVEPTPFMRRILTARRLLQAGRDRIAVVDGAAEKLPVADDSIDAIWAVNTMHHWLDTGRAAGEIARALGPGGRVLLVDEDFQDPTHPDFERFGSDDDDEDHHHGFTLVDADDMGELLAGVGLVDITAGKRTIIGRPVIAVTARAPA